METPHLSELRARPALASTVDPSARGMAAQLQGLVEVARAVNRALSVSEILRTVVDHARVIVGAELGVCSLRVPGTAAADGWPQDHVHASGETGSHDLAALCGPHLVGLVCASNDAVRLTRDRLRALPEPGPSLRGWLAAPLHDRNGGTLGVIQLGDKEQGEFDETDEAVLVQLGQMAAVAIEKVDLAQRVAAQEAARFREELLSGISHDMQTPVATIVGLADLLVDDPPVDADERETIHATIGRQARNLRGLVQQFLDFSRLESDRPLVLRPRPTDVVAAIDRTVQLFEHHREIVVGATSGLPPALADPDRLDQILVNLVSNAVKYSDGPVRVVARAEDGAVLIDVVDEGPGIAEDEVAQLFVKFHRGPSAAGTSGTGLGLYISRALIDAQGGSLSVHSNPGVGSRFQVRLPVAGPA